jgi:hypothetical protein
MYPLFAIVVAVRCWSNRGISVLHHPLLVGAVGGIVVVAGVVVVGGFGT